MEVFIVSEIIVKQKVTKHLTKQLTTHTCTRARSHARTRARPCMFAQDLLNRLTVEDKIMAAEWVAHLQVLPLRLPY